MRLVTRYYFTDSGDRFLKRRLLGLDVIPDNDLDVFVIDLVAGLLLHTFDDRPGLVGAQFLLQKNGAGMALLAFFLEDRSLPLLSFDMVLDQPIDVFPADIGLVLLFHSRDGLEPGFFGTIRVHGQVRIMTVTAFGLEELGSGRSRGGFLSGGLITAEGGDHDESGK